jgi:hypothetical protein
VLREGLAGREQLYGQGHPGYAFGLEPLASVLFRLGKTDEALDWYDKAKAIEKRLASSDTSQAGRDFTARGTF